MKDIIKKYEIIGIVSNYKISLDNSLKVKDLDIKNLPQALKMVGLTEDCIDKFINDLTLSELFKVDLATKLNKDIIVIGGLSNYLNYKDQEYIKKILTKLNQDYHKYIIVIDENVKVFINLVKRIYVLDNKNIVYETSDFYDLELYKYTKMPKIIEFINYVNQNNKINKTLDIYELIKDIFRSVS